MLLANVFAVFAYGLRHGADPDHLAAIDAVTRNSHRDQPRASRFVGALFAGGHSVMVLAVAALVGATSAAALGHFPALLRLADIANVGILIALAVVNLSSLSSTGKAGAKVRLLPRVLRTTRNPLVAIPIGLLFGLGLETSSQVATFALVASADAGALGGLAIGAAFCAGVTVTDLADGILVHRFLSAPSARAITIQRTWAWTVSLIALTIALFQGAEFFGWQPPFPEIALSIATIVTLSAVFGASLVQMRNPLLVADSSLERPQ